jgi:nitroimidazol reductase NimA-like FMN-containing flavoprotein (pyridoxamine 5'-phosphate oxidase superfamily)
MDIPVRKVTGRKDEIKRFCFMRKSNQEIRDNNLLEEILAGAQICRIAMMDGNRPCILPFNYGYREHCIYIHSAPEGKKIELLKQDNRVCFEIEHTVRIIKDEKACKWATLYRSVVGYGTVEIVTDDKGKRRGLEIIMAQHGVPDLIDFEPEQMNHMVILKLTITSLTGKQSGNWNREHTI